MTGFCILNSAKSCPFCVINGGFTRSQIFATFGEIKKSMTKKVSLIKRRNVHPGFWGKGGGVGGVAEGGVVLWCLAPLQVVYGCSHGIFAKQKCI